MRVVLGRGKGIRARWGAVRDKSKEKGREKERISRLENDFLKWPLLVSIVA